MCCHSQKVSTRARTRGIISVIIFHLSRGAVGLAWANVVAMWSGQNALRVALTASAFQKLGRYEDELIFSKIYTDGLAVIMNIREFVRGLNIVEMPIAAHFWIPPVIMLLA